MAAMVEDVNYTSVVFKTNRHSPPEAPKEETVYDEVNVRRETIELSGDTNAGFLPDKKSNSRRHHCQQPSCCLGILCVILLLGIIAVCGYFTSLKSDLETQNKQLKTQNQQLETQNQQLETQNQQLETQNQQLETQNQQLETQNQQLQTEGNTFKKTIEDMEAKRNEINVSRAQWSIDAYCPLKHRERPCKPCQSGWIHLQSSCYVIHNPGPDKWMSWDEAQTRCKGQNSDLVVVVNEQEKTFISGKSWGSSGTSGYWIGLRVKDGKWKWVDGSDLTDSSWIKPPTDGHCAISVENMGWKSVRCSAKNQWICKRKALVLG